LKQQESAKEKSFFDKRNIKDLIAEVQEVYLEDTRPWVIGYSGGKDSSAVVQLIFYALEKLPPEKRKKKVFVISSDTLVETPVIVEHIWQNIKMIGEAARAKGLPMETEIVRPQVTETFWVNIIGKGYPAPTNQFRWCTDRMKIKPANRFILDRVAEHGEVVVVLGVRSAESATRQQVINLHKIPGQLLSRHSTLPNAFVYSPIVDFSTQDVWTFLLQSKNPWGGDNHRLMALYKNAAQGECPLVIDTSTPSCGNSRFGCWTCTVVSSDKSMRAMIDNGEDWMEPLIQFRELLAETQAPEVKSKYRDYKRRDGKVMLKNRDESDEEVIFGPYKFEFRKELLEKLLRIQLEISKQDRSIDLITRGELAEIRRLWFLEQQDWGDSINQIYEGVFGHPFDTEKSARPVFSKDDLEVLKSVAGDNQVPWQMVAKLIDVEKAYDSVSRRSKIFSELLEVLSESWDDQETEVGRVRSRKQLRLDIQSGKSGIVSEGHSQ
jgi:DNA sulfur modification protein DndC